ncbi:MAG: FHA domain-containing protein [Planctomycetota bacterium]|jgi:hypothetical protein
MISAIFHQSTDNAAIARRYMAWIDGVGNWLIVTSPEVTVGRSTGGTGPLARISEPDEADCPLVANLSRKHIRLERDDESYVLEARAATSVNRRPVEDRIVLPNECSIELTSGVRLGFRIPTQLSASAQLTFESSHRPQTAVSGVILMADTCVLGPGTQSHIRCESWPESIILVRTADGIRLKSPLPLIVDGRYSTAQQIISDGQVVRGPDGVQFRLEPLDERQ